MGSGRMTLADSNSVLRGFGLARLGVAALLLVMGPTLPEELLPGTNRGILALVVLVVAGSSGALVAFAPRVPHSRVAWLVCLDRKSTRLNSSHMSISYA